MKPNYKNTLLKHDGKTSDIVQAVIGVYNKDYAQVNELAQTLKTDNIETTCLNIFNYVIENVNYKEDKPGVQWVKNPARLLAEKVGDCKSMSIFSASCLRCLDIEHFFRFVSFNDKKEATHVYVIAIDETGKQIIIDPVVRPVQFNKEEKYTYKSDMSGTDIYYMSGIPTRKAVGSTDVSMDDFLKRMEIWTGNDEDNNITPGKHWLYTEFDLYTELFNIAKTNLEKISALNRLSIISALLWSYNDVKGNTEDFKYYALIICGLIADGFFDSNTTDLTKRANEFDGIIDVINEKIVTHVMPQFFASEWFELIDTEVLQHNEPVFVPSVTGIGNIIEDLNGTTAANKIKAGAMFHLFQFVPDTELNNYPASLRTKREIQQRTFTFIHKTDPWHNEASVKNLIRSGIIAATGMTPENYIKSESGKKAITGIGWVQVVLGIVQIILAFVALLKALFGGSNSTPTESEINKAIPDTTDLQTKTTKSSFPFWLLPIGLAGGYVATKKGKNKNKK